MQNTILKHFLLFSLSFLFNNCNIKIIKFYTHNEHNNPFCTSNSKMRTLENSEDPDEMPPYAAFHQGLHFLLRKKYNFIWKILPVTP